MPFAWLRSLKRSCRFLCIAAVVALLGSNAGKPEDTAPTTQTEFIIPLDDFQREVAVVPRGRALAQRGLSPEALRSLCDQELSKQGHSGDVDPKRIVFRASHYKYLSNDIRLVDVASAEVRPITFVPQAELKDLAAKLMGDNKELAFQSRLKLISLGGRAKNITPLLVPRIAGATTPCEVDRVLGALRLIGPHAAEALPVFVQKFKSADDEDKRAYAYSMRSIGDPAIPALRQLLWEESSPLARLAAGEALREIGPKGWAVLYAAMSDASPEVRIAAAAASGSCGDPTIIEHLIPLLKDAQREVRQTAARSLTRLAHKTFVQKSLARIGDNAVPLLLGMLEEDNASSRECAMAALGAIHRQPDRVLPKLEPFLERGADRILRGAALEAVGGFGPDAAALVPQVVASLDGDRVETEKALHAIAAIGGKPIAVAAPKAAALALSKDWSIAEAGLEALFSMGPAAAPYSAILIPLLKSRDHNRQRAVLYALGAMGPEAKDALPGMVPLLTSRGSMHQLPEKIVRSMAAIDVDHAIAAIEAHLRIVPSLGDGFRVKDWRAESLEMLQHIKSHAKEIALLADGKDQVRLKKALTPFVPFPVGDWRRVLRPGDTIDRVIAAMGTPDSVGPESIIYDAQSGALPEYRPADGLILSIKHGKVTEVQRRRP